MKKPMKVERKSSPFSVRHLFYKEKLFCFDKILFLLLVLFLSVNILLFAKANLISDSIDYYSIVQKLVDSDSNTLFPTIPFVEERFGGYSTISVIPYYGLKILVEHFVQTENITEPLPPFIPVEQKMPQVQIPSRDYPIFAVPFKNIYLENSNSTLEWTILLSMIITSYVLFFFGLYLIVKTQKLIFGEKSLIFFIPLIILVSSAFMFNLIQTPTYATLAAFGICSAFVYLFVSTFANANKNKFFFLGLVVAILSFTRPEGLVIGLILFFYLLFKKENHFTRWFIFGFIFLVPLFLIYNYLMFQNPLHFGFIGSQINQIKFNLSFILAALVNPNSGILFISPFVVLGVIGLFLSKENKIKLLGIISVIVMLVILFRVPVMYQCDSQNPPIIKGLMVGCASTEMESLSLVKSDINRYAIILMPLAFVGIGVIFNTILLRLKYK